MRVIDKFKQTRIGCSDSSLKTNFSIIKIHLRKNAKALCFLLLVLTAISCKKLVDVNGPVTSTNSANVYENDATVAAVLTGLYANMSGSGFLNGSIPSLSLFAGLSADELTLYDGIGDPAYIGYYTNSLSNKNTGFVDFWNNIYPSIYTVNSAIEGLTSSGSLTPVVKHQLLGEAKFLRAFYYFNLVTLYGDVPLALTSNYKVNSVLARSPAKQVYQQIIQDLVDAQGLLSSDYLDATLLKTTVERVRPTKWAASALLARVYLYFGDVTNDASQYTSAVAQSSILINNISLFGLSSLNNTFLKASLGNNEAIWQLQPVALGQNTQDALAFIIPSTGLSDPNNPVSINNDLLNSFEAGDQRKINWIDTVTSNGILYYFPYKYKVNTLNAPVTEYEMVLRLGEQYLIRAEAEAKLGNNAAVTDLNTIRNRAGLVNYVGAADKSSLLTAIFHERQVELFTEWGHRWLDLKRTGRAAAVLSPIKPNWQAYKELYPIPEAQLINDPNLTQNPGY